MPPAAAPRPGRKRPCTLFPPQYMACPFPAVLGELSSLTLLDLAVNDLSGFLHRDVAAGECVCVCLGGLLRPGGAGSVRAAVGQVCRARTSMILPGLIPVTRLGVRPCIWILGGSLGLDLL